MESNRRNFFKRLLVAAGVAGTGGLGAGVYAYAIEPRLIRIKEYDLPTKKWPTSHKSLRVAIAGDFHVGCPSIDLDAMDGVVDRINALSADIILLVGDFLIGGVVGGKYIGPEPIAGKLSRLKAPLGVHAVLGNHDWWKEGEAMWAALEKAGIKVFENNAVRISHAGGDFWLAGLADDTTRTPDIAKTLGDVKDDAPVIMMSHDPAPFLEMNERPVVTVCGHTHGGQVALPFWGALVIPGRAPIRYAYGHVNEGNRDMIVTSGLGTSILPVRFSRRPEIISLTIRST